MGNCCLNTQEPMTSINQNRNPSICHQNASKPRQKMSFPETPKYDRKRSNRPRKNNIGLTNEGNTCFINCSMQVLCSIPELANIYLSTRGQSMIGLQRQLWRLVNAMWESSQERAADFNKVRRQQIRNSKQSYSMQSFYKEIVEKFDIYREKMYCQMDASEFVQIFLNYLCKSDTWAINNPNTSSAKGIFEGLIHTTITCQPCKSNSVDIKQRFLIVPLAIVEQGQKGCIKSIKNRIKHSLSRSESIKLEDCLSSFKKRTVLDGDNIWPCKKCRTDTISIKQMQICEVGSIFILQLLRFVKEQKNGIIVEYPQTLQLDTLKNNRNDKFSLIGVICHLGSTIKSGHYISYALNPYYNTWDRYSDNSFRQAKNYEYLNNKDAYLLFYQRI